MRVFSAVVVRRIFSRITSFGVLPSISHGSALEAELNVLRPRRQHVDVIVGVIADRMTRLGDLLEPGDALLFEDAADGEAVQHAAGRLDALARRDGVLLRLVVEIALFVVPMGVIPLGKVAAHFHVESDRDQRLVGVGVLLEAGRLGEEIAHAGGDGAGEEAAAGEMAGWGSSHGLLIWGRLTRYGTRWPGIVLAIAQAGGYA